jgi:cytochrome c-type biogenesis protein CcmE
MTRKQRRIAIIAAVGVVLGSATGLTMYALRDAIVFFHTPSEAQAKGLQPGQRFRLGGLVASGSVDKGVGERVAFAVTDGTATLKVSYIGILPDLFREGQGVVAEGALQADGTFKADTVLAKHDETYMPKEVADSLKKQGHWKNGAPPASAPRTQ